MLEPGQRSHLHALLRPPPGHRFDSAVGTTYSLDLLSALTVPLSFAMLDWENPDGEQTANPLAMLEAMGRYREKITIFAQAGQIRFPKEYPKLLMFLEDVVVPVEAPDKAGIFHPKVWILRFVGGDGMPTYRLLCLSRNLTFDRSWDTVVCLDEQPSDKGRVRTNAPLADFVLRLPDLAVSERSLSANRQAGIQQMAEELKNVDFQPPDGFEDYAFHVGGLNGKECFPFALRDKCLLVSPFLHPHIVTRFVSGCRESHLISRPESIDALAPDLLSQCSSLRILKHEALEQNEEIEGGTNAGNEERLDGLHAKVFVVDHGTASSVYSGSFNATRHAFHHNVEFMVELRGKKSRIGVDHFLEQRKPEVRFADLFEKISPGTRSQPSDPARKKLDDLIRRCKQRIISGLRGLQVTKAKVPGLFRLRLDWEMPAGWPPDAAQVRVWPVSLPAIQGKELAGGVEFENLSFEALTAFLAFEIRAKSDGLSETVLFVHNLPVEGMPADREDRLVRSLVANRDGLLRYLHFLLIAGDEDRAPEGQLMRLIAGEGVASRSVLPANLFEELVRTLHRQPEQFDRIAKLLESIERSAKTGEDDLIDDGLHEIWEPIRAVAKERRKR